MALLRNSVGTRQYVTVPFAGGTTSGQLTGRQSFVGQPHEGTIYQLEIGETGRRVVSRSHCGHASPRTACEVETGAARISTYRHFNSPSRQRRQH